MTTPTSTPTSNTNQNTSGSSSSSSSTSSSRHPTRRLLILKEMRNPHNQVETVYVTVNTHGLLICGSGPELPSLLDLPLRTLTGFTEMFNRSKYQNWAIVGAAPYHDTSEEGKFYAVVLEQSFTLTSLPSTTLFSQHTATNVSHLDNSNNKARHSILSLMKVENEGKNTSPSTTESMVLVEEQNKAPDLAQLGTRKLLVFHHNEEEDKVKLVNHPGLRVSETSPYSTNNRCNATNSVLLAEITRLLTEDAAFAQWYELFRNFSQSGVKPLAGVMSSTMQSFRGATNNATTIIIVIMSLIHQPQLPLQLRQPNELPSEQPMLIPIPIRIPFLIFYSTPTRELKLLIFEGDKGSGPTPAKGSQTLRLVNPPGIPISDSVPFLADMLADMPSVPPPKKLVEKVTDVMKDRAYEGWTYLHFWGDWYERRYCYFVVLQRWCWCWGWNSLSAPYHTLPYYSNRYEPSQISDCDWARETNDQDQVGYLTWP
ncbi:hypothetical protein VTN00DRAFT_4323 [Thermoascus crustaceus]|uniref:uncharacterized protein n=1 Tax=Thermoascus crustaceus TaxID=5088 RepID=UPI003743946D